MARKTLHAAEREQIFLRACGMCSACGLFCEAHWNVYKPSVMHFTLNETHEIHHIVPMYDGGTDKFDNLTLLCVPCHKKTTVVWKAESQI